MKKHNIFYTNEKELMVWDGILLKSIQKIVEVLQQITKTYLTFEHPCVA